MSKTRVRFAPSPTGKFHVGSARSALFNYLFARKNNGSFVLRFEDTDSKRSEKKYEKDMLESMNWLGITPDESVEKGGDYGPYRQSDRLDFYRDYIETLLDEGKAYFCFCDKEELEKQKEKQKERGETPRYTGACRNLSEKEVQKKLENEEDYVIRFKVEKGKTVTFSDKIQGEISFETDHMGDFVIARGKEDPLYNFACVVDDHEMDISHVIRGDEHISNTPKQILIYEALDLTPPKFAHIPLILGPDKSKLSKRFGAVSIAEFKKEGYLPEGLNNGLALLGWSPGNDREFFTLKQLENTFSLERCKKSGAVFDKNKLRYINAQHLKKADPERLGRLIIPYLIEEGYLEPSFDEEQVPPALGGKAPKAVYISQTGQKFNFDQLKEIAEIHNDRVEVLSEITEVADCFFTEIETDFELLQWKDMEKDEVRDELDKAKLTLSNIKEWDKETVKNELLKTANELGDRGRFLWPLRAALTGKEESAGPFEIAYVLEKKEAIRRIEKAINSL